VAKIQSHEHEKGNCLIYIVSIFLLLFLLYILQTVGIWAWVIFLIVFTTLVVYAIINSNSKTKLIKLNESEWLLFRRRRIITLLREKMKIDIQQQEYKEKIEKLFMEIKDSLEIKTILENFFPKIPMKIFVNNDIYSFFEIEFLKGYVIGSKILWSSELDSKGGLSFFEREIEIHYPNATTLKNEVISFVNNDLEKLKKLLKSLVVYENDYDYSFVLLRILQLAASSYYSQVFLMLCNADFGDIEKITLEECLFIYFSKCHNQAFDTLFGDPAISLFTYFILNHKKFGESNSMDYYNYLTRRNELIELLNDKKEDFDYRIFEANMKKKLQIPKDGCSIVDVDLMSGDEFENFVAKIFSKLGYLTKVTQHSRDFGVDVIAEKDGIKIAIQAKCYTNPVSISAIQEVTAGMTHYNCQRGVIVTNRTFTKAAIELASSNSIQLWDRKKLEEKISEVL
jgi:HJR/Mrr/RecB family endonuclease